MSKETKTKSTSSSVLPNSAQVLTDSQQSLMDNIKYPAGYKDPNPELTPSPFPWSGSYISPAWYGSYGQHGNGSGEGFIHSNQFNSAVTQPLGLDINWLGREHTVGQRLVNQHGGMVEQYESLQSPFVLQNHKSRIPSQKFGNGKKKCFKRK